MDSSLDSSMEDVEVQVVILDPDMKEKEVYNVPADRSKQISEKEDEERKEDDEQQEDDEQKEEEEKEEEVEDEDDDMEDDEEEEEVADVDIEKEGKDVEMESKLPESSCTVPTFVDIHREYKSGENEIVHVKPSSDAPDDAKPSGSGVKRTRRKRLRDENGVLVPTEPIQCPECDMQFKVFYRFKRHLRTHTGEKPYKCSECGKCFNRMHHLKAHFMIHTGEKPFKCEQCEWAFMKKYHLQRHQKTHDKDKERERDQIRIGEKPYSCEHCKKAFFRRHYLTKHMKTHSEDEPYVCSECGVHFSQKASLKRHMRDHRTNVESNSGSPSGNRVELAVSIVVGGDEDISVKEEGSNEVAPHCDEKVSPYDEKSSVSTAHLNECIDVLNHLTEKKNAIETVDYPSKGGVVFADNGDAKKETVVESPLNDHSTENVFKNGAVKEEEILEVLPEKKVAISNGISNGTTMEGSNHHVWNETRRSPPPKCTEERSIDVVRISALN